MNFIELMDEQNESEDTFKAISWWPGVGIVAWIIGVGVVLYYSGVWR